MWLDTGDTFEIFRVDEFVKFHEFYANLPVHTKEFDDVKNITNTYLWLLSSKIYISPVLSIYMDVNVPFSLFHYW